LTEIAARRRLAARLGEAGIESAVVDARWLAEAAFQDASTEDAARLRLDEFGARRLAGEPVWRIIGERDFWGLPFRLSPATLEPRPDSETIVEAALEAIEARRREPLAILDLGTGTGCLLIALLSECGAAWGLGIDLSAEACATARANAVRNGVAARATFREGDWTKGIDGRFDLVVSNPPYIPEGEIAGLAREVREHDPHLALSGGYDGLDAYRALARGVLHVLAEGASLVLEIGAGQERDVIAIMTEAGLVHRGSRRDLGGHLRALIFAA
jgi:release factor glutamine methyltransferase